MAASPLTILVDYRERGSGVVEALRRHDTCFAETKLEIADYVVAQGVGIERKTVRDLHASIRDGRLWTQVASLRLDLDAAFLIVEGTALDGGPLSSAGVRGALLEVISLGVPVIRSENVRDTASWLVRIAARATRLPARRPCRSRSRAPVTPVSLLCSLPGVSTRTAAELLARFGSVGAVARAPKAELMRVHGVGSTRADIIRQCLGSP